MKNILVTVAALFTGLIALFTSLLLAIPLTIAALITGKKIQKQMSQQGFTSRMNNHYSANRDVGVIEGEYEDLSNKR